MHPVTRFAALVMLVAAAAPNALPAQGTVRRPAPVRAGRGGDGAARDQVPVTVALRVGGKTHRVSGEGTCKYAPRASMYDMAASLWTVQLAPASMSVWRPLKGGSMQLALSVQDGRAVHRISTVYKTPAVGSGRVTFQPRGAGGRFEISGRSGDGATIRGTIDCARMTGIEAEGG